MTQISNPFQALNSIFVKPNPVFQTVSQVNNWSWLPFIIINVIAVLSINLYFNFVDFNWYVDSLIQQSMADTSPAEQQGFRDQMSKDIIAISGMAMVILGSVVVTAIFAAYLNTMTRSDDSHTHGFTDWYGAMWWVQMPAIINALLAILLIFLSSNHEISPVSLSPLSVAFIVGTDMGSDWFNFLTSLRLDSIWSIYLLTVCVSQWTSFDTRKSFIVALAPYAIIYGLWFLFLVF